MDAMQAQVEAAQAVAAGRAPGKVWPGPQAQSYRVDDGGAVAFRKSPSSDDRSSKAAEAGLLINEVGRVVTATGEVWIQHSNELWLPMAFLEPYNPDGVDEAAPAAKSVPTPEPEPEPEQSAGDSSDKAPPNQPNASVSTMVAKLNSAKDGAQDRTTRPVARAGGSADESSGSESWGDGGSAALARVAVRANAAECEAQRARADASAKDVERLVATVAELKAALRQSKHAADESEAERQQLATAAGKLEGESAENKEKAISSRRMLEEEKSHGAVLAKQAERADERMVEMARELTDSRMQLSALQTRAASLAAQLHGAEEAASAAQKAMDEKVEEIRRRCDLAVQRGDELQTLQEMAVANAAATQQSSAAAYVTSQGNGSNAAALAALEIKVADKERVIDVLQDELRWHRRQQGRIERAVRVCIKRTWRRSQSWWAFAVWKQSGTLSGKEPAYSKSQSIAVEAAEAEAEKKNAGEAESGTNGSRAGGNGGKANALWAVARDAAGIRRPPVRHPGVKCDASGMFPITGNRYQKLEEDFDLCEAEWLHLPEQEQKNYMLITHPGAVPCSPFEADAEAEIMAKESERKRKEDEEQAAKNAADDLARVEKEAKAKIQAQQFVAQGFSVLFQASGDERDAAWDKAQKCFERALTWRPDSAQAAKGLAELRALRAAANGIGWDVADDTHEEDTNDDERQQPLRATITGFKMQHRDMGGNEVPAFVEYTMSVRGGGSTQHTVLRRFSSFKTLHKELAAALPGAYHETQATQHLFSFSLMTWFDTLDRDFIEQRAHWLRVYLSELVGSPNLCQQPRVRSFLQLDNENENQTASVSAGTTAHAGAAAPAPAPAASGGAQLESNTRELDSTEGAASTGNAIAEQREGDDELEQQLRTLGQQRVQDGSTDDQGDAAREPSGGQVREHEAHQVRGGDEGEHNDDEDDAAFERRLLEGSNPTALESAPGPTGPAAGAVPGNGHSVATQQRQTDGHGYSSTASPLGAAAPVTPQRRLPANMPRTPRSAVSSGGSASSAMSTAGGGPPELPRTPLRATFAMGSGDSFRSPQHTGNAGMPAPSSISSNFSPYLGEQRRFLASTPLRSPHHTTGHDVNTGRGGNGNGSGRTGLAYSSPRGISASPMSRNFEFDSDSDFGAGPFRTPIAVAPKMRSCTRNTAGCAAALAKHSTHISRRSQSLFRS